MEKTAIKSGIFAGIAGIGAGIAYNQQSNLSSLKNDVPLDSNSTTTSIDGRVGVYDPGDKIEVINSTTGEVVANGSVTDHTRYNTNGQLITFDKNVENAITDKWQSGTDNITTGTKIGKNSEIRIVDKTNATNTKTDLGNISSILTAIITSMASLIFGVMWGSLIIAGVQGVRTGIYAHKANVMRREEILQQLKNSKKE